MVAVDGVQALAGFVGAGGQLGTQLGSVLTPFQLGKRQLQFLLVKKGVNGHSTGTQNRGHPVTGHPQAGAQLVNFGKALVQPGSGGSGHDRIHGKSDQQHTVDGQHYPHRHRCGGADKKRMHHLDHQHAAQAPQQAEQRADVAAQIEPAVGVIPPADVENLEQRPPADQLNGRGQHHTDHKDRAGADILQFVPGQQLKAVDQRHHAKAVDRADGSAQKPAVDKAMLLDGGKHDLYTPADAAVDKKPEHRLHQKLIHPPAPPAAWQAPSARPTSRRCRGLCGQSTP